mgnify:CR=1 FL=1
MLHLIKVEGNSNLRRDKRTGAIVAINTTDLEKAKRKKLNNKEKDNKIKSLEEKVEKLERLMGI